MPSLPKADFKGPASICADRTLPALFALVTNFEARLSAIQAFQAIGFRTLSVSVIFLDLTEIIAFDAVREWEAARRLRCEVPGMGWNGKLRSHGKKVRFA
jgi:general L-amino acid transport system substrate-binding protein